MKHLGLAMSPETLNPESKMGTLNPKTFESGRFCLVNYGAFLVSKFKTSFLTCYFSIQVFNPVIKT